MSAITLSNVTKVFGAGGDAVTAVADLSLSVGDGEFFAILGPSGSGKTTVLRMIAGFEHPTSGVIELGGADVTGQPPYRRDVNTVFQDYALFPHLNVGQNVGYGLKVSGVPAAEREARVAEALESVQLGGYGSRKPGQLSGGQRQRVALARALIKRPRVLLLDEPLGALDLKLREEMQVELKSIQRASGITFVLVTHDQDEALTLADRVAVFNGGRIEQVGVATEVYERPASPFVATFVGTSNLLEDAVGTFAVRPERVRVTAAPAGDATGGHGSNPISSSAGETAEGLRGMVHEVVYSGADTRVVADVPGHGQLVALCRSSDLPAGLGRGSEVHLSWAGENTIRFP